MHRFAKYCWFVLAWTLLVILWGAYVRASGSGAGCGNHWPTCNGEIIPHPRQIETIIEFTHRLLSGGAILFISIMTIWGWRLTQKGGEIRKGLVASGFFIISEALLGAGLVLFKLVEDNQSAFRAAIMALHLLNTFFLIGSITLTAWWAGGGNPIKVSNQGDMPFFLFTGLAGVAIIGMSGAITALGDTLFPVRTLAEGLAQDANTNVHFLIQLRIYHPLIALGVGGYTLFLLRHLRKTNIGTRTRKIGLSLAILILFQWAAGLVNVILLAPLPMQIIHLFIADLVWISYVLLTASSLGESTTQQAPIQV
jgi:heme A synthase